MGRPLLVAHGRHVEASGKLAKTTLMLGFMAYAAAVAGTARVGAAAAVALISSDSLG